MLEMMEFTKEEYTTKFEDFNRKTDAAPTGFCSGKAPKASAFG